MKTFPPLITNDHKDVAGRSKSPKGEFSEASSDVQPLYHDNSQVYDYQDTCNIFDETGLVFPVHSTVHHSSAIVFVFAPIKALSLRVSSATLQNVCLNSKNLSELLSIGLENAHDSQFIEQHK